MAGSSFFSGVSGLKSHQTKMDVIGNNIANVNTHGFKVGRATFGDLISQTFRGPSQPSPNRGGTNPLQVGLGTQIASVDNIMVQGVLETTGRQSDVAIQGNGFFVVETGTSSYYTRNGNFNFDRDGTLVNPAGFRVQGWSRQVVDEANNIIIDTTGAIDDLHLIVGEKIEAKATERVIFRSNLNAASRDMGPALESDPLVDLYNGASPEPTHLGIRPGDVLQIAVELDIDSAAPGSLDKFDVRYYAITNNTTTKDLEGWIQEVIDSADTTGTANVSVAFDNGAFTVNNQLLAPDTNDVLLSVRAASGKDIRNYAREQGTLKYENLTDDIATVKEFFRVQDNAGTSLGRDVFNTHFNNGLGAGIALNYDATDDPQEVGNTIFNNFVGLTTINDPAAPLTSTIVNLDSQYGFVQSSATRKTSIDVYDSLGNSHTLQMTFQHQGATVKGGVAFKNLWDWRPEFEFADEYAFDSLAINGGNNFFTFQNNGLLDPGRLTGDITFDASPLMGDQPTPPPFANMVSSKSVKTNNVTLQWGLPDNLIAGITQYASDFTTAAINQDGYPLGVLESYFIDQIGSINGIYSNDLRRPVGQLAVAVFDNAEGLTKTGGTLFQQSNNSGLARVVPALIGGAGEIAAATLEQSNVDLSNEFTSMIITQRGFQANARTITTSDEMLQELIALKR